MKKLLTLGAFLALLTSSVLGTVTISFGNGEDDNATPAKVTTSAAYRVQGGTQQTKSLLEGPPMLSTSPNRIFQFSVASSSSPYTTQVRQNIMKWLAGLPVTMDRTYDPTAAYLISRHNGWASMSGLQLYDVATTSFPFWDGLTPPATNSPALATATGHRIVVPLIMSGNQMRKYWVRMTTTSSIIGNSMFPVATNSANGQEIAFNPQYVGIGLGADRKLDSFADPATGQWVKGGDDQVLTSGFPSGLEGQYDHVLRFGSTIVVTASDYQSFNALKNEFASKVIMIKVELVLKNGDSETVLDSYVTTSAQAGLKIELAGLEKVKLTIVGGQKMLVYGLEASPEVTGVYTNAHPDLLATGRFWEEPALFPMHFYRLRNATTAVP